MTCKRLYSIVSDPRVWDCLVWRRSEHYIKALQAALRLSSYHVRNLVIYSRPSNPISWALRRPFPVSVYLPQVHEFKKLCSLTLNEVPDQLDEILVQLPSLKALTVTGETRHPGEIIRSTSSKRQLTHLCLQSSASEALECWKQAAYHPPYLSVYDPNSSWQLKSKNIFSV